MYITLSDFKESEIWSIIILIIHVYLREIFSFLLKDLLKDPIHVFCIIIFFNENYSSLSITYKDNTYIYLYIYRYVIAETQEIT
jgi:hypothetical protein